MDTGIDIEVVDDQEVDAFAYGHAEGGTWEGTIAEDDSSGTSTESIYLTPGEFDCEGDTATAGAADVGAATGEKVGVCICAGHGSCDGGGSQREDRKGLGEG